MYEKAFVKFYGSEQQLKELIHNTLKSLNLLLPDKWSDKLIVYADPSKPSKEILYNLIANIPPIAELEELFEVTDVVEILRIVAVKLNNLLNFERFEYLSLNLIYTNFHSLFIANRYLLAVEFINKELRSKLIYDPDIVLDWLNLDNSKEKNLTQTLTAVIAANEEISKLLQNEDAGPIYQELLLKNEQGIENYLKESFAGLFVIGFARLVIEAVTKGLPVFEKYYNFEGDSIHKLESLFKLFSKTENQLRSSRLGIKRGGARKREGFAWKNENKKAFYQKVIGLPKINNRPMWQYALDELIEKDFDSQIVGYLKTKTPFKDVPPELFNEAIKTWKKYKDELISIKQKESPRAFEFRHAIHLLKYSKLSFSSAKNYFNEGKKLSTPDK
jgi:hypothetical protein